MLHKCFLCTGDIRPTGWTPNSKENSTLLLCQILGVPHLEFDLMNSDGADYCRPCSYRILSIRDMLEEFEKLEKKILDEKYLIQVQLKENARLGLGDCETDGQNSGDPANQLRMKIGRALTAGTIQSVLSKIRTKQVDRADSFSCHQAEQSFRIIECARIPKYPTTDNVADNSDDQHQWPPSRRDIRMLIPSAPIDDEQSFLIQGNLDSQANWTEEVPFNPVLSPISSTELKFDDDEVESTYETRLQNSNLSEVHNDHNHNPFDDELVPLSEYAAPNRMHDQILAGTSTGSITILPTTAKVEVKVECESTTEGNSLPCITFVCLTCGLSFGCYSQLLIHDRLHTRTTKSNKFKVSQMNIQNTTRVATQRPNLKPSRRPRKCEECGRMLASQSSWRFHVMQVHRRQHKYNCALCSFGCQQKSSLDGHMLTHSDVRKFKCHLCPASFKQKKGLDRHFKTHTN